MSLRQEAINQGLIKYISNKPCSQGHGIVERYTKTTKCIECVRLSALEWKRGNRDKCNTYNAKWAKTDKGKAKHRRGDLKFNYGITVEQYNEMFEKQNGVCAICQQIETSTYKGKIRNLAVDHDHITGQIRQLLCGKCNKAIGLLNEDLLILESALEYLKTYKGN